MARGWESKSIEIQIEDAISGTSSDLKGGLPKMETDKNRKREDLLLQRARVLQDLASASNPRYRHLLEEKLAHLDNEICQFR
jgi:hypothetical protein